jgi:hypothetical protein
LSTTIIYALVPKPIFIFYSYHPANIAFLLVGTR